jgi:signal transduction histidine kinase
MNESVSSGLLERYQKLIELSRDLTSTLDLSTLLDHIVGAAANLCHAEAASILLYDEIHQQLFFQAATNLDAPKMKGLIVPVESSIAGWIIRNQAPIIVGDAQHDPRHFGNIGRITNVETRSLLGVPLSTKEKSIGVLEAINKQYGEFSLEDQELLIALGSQAAIAIENTRLFQQSDLISELVHEIRTPLASLSAATHLLSRVDLKEDLRENIMETMDQEIQRLSTLTTAFLDFARLESGRTQFNFELVKLNEILIECVVIISSEIEQKNQRMISEIAESIPLIVADYDKIKQVGLNLLSNAVKYSPEGGLIKLSATSKGEEVVFQITDTGPGIPPESLPHLFEKFYRVPGVERTSQGTGLGLSICQRIVDAHSGHIEVQSQVGKGTIFSVYLPSRPKSKTGNLVLVPIP